MPQYSDPESKKFISYIPPTVVVKLLQYSGLGLNTDMGFLCTNDLLLRPKMVNFKFGFLRVAVKIGDWLFTG